MTNSVAVLLTFFQGPSCPDCLDLVRQVFVSAIKDAQPEIIEYAPADVPVRLNLASFVCGISTADRKDYSGPEVEQAIGGVFQSVTAGEPRGDSFYIELNGLFVSPGRAEATLTFRWTLRSTGEFYEVGTRTVRIILIHGKLGWMEQSKETLYRSG